MDGVEATRQLAAEHSGAGPRVLVLTTFDLGVSSRAATHGSSVHRVQLPLPGSHAEHVGPSIPERDPKPATRSATVGRPAPRPAGLAATLAPICRDTRQVLTYRCAGRPDVNATVNRDMSVVFPFAALIITVILGLLRGVATPLYLLVAVIGSTATLGARAEGPGLDHNLIALGP